MGEGKVLILNWEGKWEEIKDVKSDPKKETRIGYNENDVILLVVIKNPGEIPRIMPVSIEDPALFISEDFGESWKSIGDKVRTEISRAVLR